MQQLLTGKKRLPGFSGEWKEVRLGDVVKIEYGKSPKGIFSETGSHPVLGTGGETGKSNHYLYDKPSVIIGRKGTIDKLQYVDTPFWAIDTTFYCKSRHQLSMLWFYNRMGMVNMRKYNEASGVPSLSRDTLYSIKIKVPSYDEQCSIARSLQCFNSTIELLVSNRANLKVQKQALMQQLLTGKTRVNVE